VSDANRPQHETAPEGRTAHVIVARDAMRAANAGADNVTLNESAINESEMGRMGCCSGS
jgi:hypothetical protein